jgi:hypothetical protein
MKDPGIIYNNIMLFRHFNAVYLSNKRKFNLHSKETSTVWKQLLE